MLRAAAFVAFAAAASPTWAESFRVDPEAGNSTFSAIFDAKLGERITAMSSSVGCEIAYDEKTGLANGTCSAPLSSVRVDNEPTKTGHFQEWATNKKSKATDCKFEAKFENVKIGVLKPEQPTPFTAEIPFTVCGRGRTDGGKERLTGTAVLFPPGSYGASKTIRVRATVQSFNRDAYRIGPKYTEGWLARVQSLAKVVAEEGTIEIAIFAKAQPATGVAKQQ